MEEVSTNETGIDNSILNNIKKLLGVSKDDINFDEDIILNINSVFMILNQMGVGPDLGFRITDSSKNWSDYISDDKYLDAIKTYIHLKVKLVFDPPLSSTVMEAHQKMISELEWRLCNN